MYFIVKRKHSKICKKNEKNEVGKYDGVHTNTQIHIQHIYIYICTLRIPTHIYMNRRLTLLG